MPQDTIIGYLRIYLAASKNIAQLQIIPNQPSTFIEKDLTDETWIGGGSWTSNTLTSNTITTCSYVLSSPHQLRKPDKKEATVAYKYLPTLHNSSAQHCHQSFILLHHQQLVAPRSHPRARRGKIHREGNTLGGTG